MVYLLRFGWIACRVRFDYGVWMFVVGVALLACQVALVASACFGWLCFGLGLRICWLYWLLPKLLVNFVLRFAVCVVLIVLCLL